MTREALRQELLLRALWRDSAPATLQGWLRPRADRGLKTYRANAGALAERALSAAYPTVAALVGDESFAALARDFWQQHAPARGDIGEWGDALPAFIAGSTALADEPYLADSARLDWLVHQATRAADASAAASDWQQLGRTDPTQVHLCPAPGAALLGSAWPVVAIFQAHQQQSDDRFAPVREAFAAGRGDNAFVWRDGPAVRVERVDAADAAFLRALIDGLTLGDALDRMASGFAFEVWLARAITARWIAAIDVHEPMQEAAA